jgi:MFS family permease
MLIDMGGDKKVGVYTGLYYFFYTLAAIAAPTFFGWFINWLGYTSMFYVSSAFILLAVLCTFGVKRGEAVAKEAAA